MARNWEGTGITWRKEEVARQFGSNRSDRKVIGEAWMPIPTDVTKIIATFGPNAVAAMLNGSSLRVKAQDVNRRAIEKKLGREWVEETVWNMLRGLRNAPTLMTTVRTVYAIDLPNGERYEGDDLNDYRASFAAALVDMGIDADVALATAEKKEFPKQQQ